MLTETTRRRRKPVSYEELSDTDELDFSDRATRRASRHLHDPSTSTPPVGGSGADDPPGDVDTSDPDAQPKPKPKLKRAGSSSSLTAATTRVAGKGKPKKAVGTPAKGKIGARKKKTSEEGENVGVVVEPEEEALIEIVVEMEAREYPDKTPRKRKTPMPTKRTPPVATAGAVATGKTPKKGKVGAVGSVAATEVKKGEAKTTAVKMKAAGGDDTTTKKKKPTKPSYDPRAVSKLAAEHPDAYWSFHATSNHGMIDDINDDNPLELVPVDVSDQGPIISMTLSPDGTLLATFCTLGSAKLWDVTPGFRLVRKLRDAAEENIDEFYCGRFAPDQAHLLVGGKLKDRKRWSAEDEDNHILPCPLKIFDVDTGVVVSTLHGHSEEILCVKALQFKGDNYYITTSQDGYIFKWRMDDDWTTLISSTRMEDGITCMAFTVSFVPDTGNKYFMAACDEHLRLYDFEDAVLLQTFEDMYSSYCDCGKFIRWSDADAFASLPLGTGDGDDKENERQEKEELVDVEAHEDDTKRGHGKAIGRKKAGGTAGAASKSAWFISRGVELCDLEEGLLPSAPNTCTLHRLVYPEKKGAPFRLDVVRKYKHADYFANSWLVKIASNGRYILAPTPYGQVFVYNIGTGEVTAMLKDHEDLEVRDVLFHPYRPLVFTCGDDGTVKIYTYASEPDLSQMDVETNSKPRDRDEVETLVAGAEALVVESEVELDAEGGMEVDEIRVEM